MAVTAADLKARFPEFASIDDAVVNRWLEEAGRSHNVAQWGGKSDDGLAYLTAHLIATFALSSGGEDCDEPNPGPVTMEREGQVQVSYAVSTAAKESDYGSTKYGRRYLQLLKTIFVTRCT